jgi:type VI protein secretion system component VasA
VTRIALTTTSRSRLALSALALLVFLALLEHSAATSLRGLKAAGLTGTPPPNSALIVRLIATLTSNWLWLVGTGVGLVLVLLAGMLAFGSRSAPDVLFRVIAGIGIILVVIPSALG